MKLTKLKALVLISAVFAAPAFAWDLSTDPLDSTAISDTTDLSVVTGYLADLGAAWDGSATDSNGAIIAQVGDAQYGFVDQTGTGNVAGIIQDGATNTASNVAYISQNGNGNFAVIKQQ